MAAISVGARDWSKVPKNINFSSKKTAELWKRHIIRQLKHRDKSQHAMFQDVIRLYTSLLEKTTITKGILGCAVRLPLAEWTSDSMSSLLSQSKELQKTTGELAFSVVELQHQMKTQDCVLEEQHARMTQVQRMLAGAKAEQQNLQARVAQVQEGNLALKRDYDCLLARHHVMEQTFRGEKDRGCELLEELIHQKEQAAVRMNSRNERRSRVREANLQRELQTAARVNVNIDISLGCSSVSAPSSRPASPKSETQDKAERPHTRLFRSASATSPRILSSIKELFERKRRGTSVSSVEEDLYCPVRICVSSRVPARALHILDAHELGINAVKFSSSSSDLLATGGTDRVIKLWDIKAGMLHYRWTLDGSTEGITSIDFDPTGMRILAGSYDKSALLWRLDDSVPKLTLTGHSRKVTAARFKCSLRQVVTGSADRTVKLWDLHRAACIQTMEVMSYCSDLVCSENCIISGHYDSKIRLWDVRANSCSEELPAQGKVTSLDMYPDLRQILSCCRDDCLQLIDLRRSNNRICFRADGFKCGSDSTKAVFSPDGGYVAAGSADGAVYVWNVANGNLEARLPEKHSSSISAVAWSVSGDYLISVDKSRRAVLWSDI
ncbi:ATG16 autophagy related 16-like 2 isoform 1-T1 [Polymixia lowei]